VTRTPDFEVCDRCAERAGQPGEAPLCAACRANQDTIHRLNRENSALVEVYVLAARMRMFPVPFDQHFELVGAVDECRSVLEPPIDNYNQPATSADAADALPAFHGAYEALHQLWVAAAEPGHSRETFLQAFREAHAALHQAWTAAVDQPGYDKKRWIALDNALSRFARCASEIFGIRRSEPLL
jgi:hypothetical protein